MSVVCRLAADRGLAVQRGTADMHVGMSELLLEFNDLDGAAERLLTSAELGEHAGLAQNPYRWHVAMARIREAEGDLDGALDLLNEADRLYVSEYYPAVRPIHAMRARMQVVGGRLRDATDWARERELSVENELSFLREFEHITLARVLLAQGRQSRDSVAANEAIALLERLLEAAEAGGRQRSVIEILVLLAIAHHTRGDSQAALEPLGRRAGLGRAGGLRPHVRG